MFHYYVIYDVVIKQELAYCFTEQAAEELGKEYGKLGYIWQVKNHYRRAREVE